MNENLWASWFPRVPMPVGITYEEFTVVRQRLVFDPDLERLDAGIRTPAEEMALARYLDEVGV